MIQQTLQHRAWLALNAVLNATDENCGHLPYQNTFLNSAPPEQRHIVSGADAGEIVGRFVIAITLAKNMLGIGEVLPQEKGLLQKLTGLQEMNDLGVCSQAATDWSKRHLVASYGEPHRMMLESFVLLVQAGHGEYAGRIERFLSGVEQTRDGWRRHRMRKSEDYVEYDSVVESIESLNPQIVAWLLDPIVEYYRQTGSPRARALMDDIASEHLLLTDPDFSEKGIFTGHSHTNLSYVTGLLKYGVATGNTDIVELCRRSYEWFRTNYGSDTGWFAEFARKDSHHDCETCVISNMIDLAILLAKTTSDPCYWNDADSFVRNQLFEQQLLTNDFIPIGLMEAHSTSDNRRSFDEVMERSVGVFHGDAAPNDFIGNYPTQNFRTMTGCCTAWGLRAIYLAWHHSVSVNSGQAVVNLWFDRDRPELSLRCHEPYRGKIEVRCRRNLDLSIRIPDWSLSRRYRSNRYEAQMERWGGNWMDLRRIRMRIDGTERRCNIGNGYLKVENLSAGSRVEIEYPLRWDKFQEQIGGHGYTAEWLGNTCIGIDPPGRILPLYNRAWMKNKRYQVVNVPYYYPEQEISL